MYERFRSLCEAHSVRPKDVSKATGIATATLSEWKLGHYQPGVEKLTKIADYFGVTLDYLVRGKEHK